MRKQLLPSLFSAMAFALYAGSALAAPPPTVKKSAPAVKKPAMPKFAPAKSSGTTKAVSNAKPGVLREPLAAGEVRSPALEVLHRFEGAMPVGVAVNSSGRIFVSYPRWTDKPEFTLGEIKDGKEVAYPEGLGQTGNKANPASNLVSLQGMVLDANDRLWILDTGTVEMKPVQPFSPKLIGIDTKTDKVVQTIVLPKAVAPEGTYLNDLRIDLRRGDGAGMAFITDSGEISPNGIICVDLKTGKAWRRLAGQPSTQAEPGFIGKPEGESLFKRPEPGVKQSVRLGSDGIAISPDGEYLYYTPLSSRKLYRVKVSALVDEGVSDTAVNRMVEDLGEKGVADGLAEDTAGRIYITDWEKRAITRRTPDGKIETFLQDDRLLWPDTLDFAQDGYLYLISNQLHRQPSYQEGKEKRQPPYLLTRVKVDDAKPVLLSNSMMPGGTNATPPKTTGGK